MDNNTLIYYRDNILESIQGIDHDRYYKNKISKADLIKLLNLTEAYFVSAKTNNDVDAINEAESFIEHLIMLSKEYDYRKSTLNEGFENPFDDVGDNTINYRYEDTVDVGTNDSIVKIGKIKLWNSNTSNKIIYKGGRMIAGQFFGVNDTIECCPVRLLYEKDLYSENIRDFAFTIDKQKGIYAIPFGYASFYRNTNDCNIDPNADYEYVNDKDGSYIRIFATRNIKKGHEIVLFSDETDFQNEIKPGQFKYDLGEEPFYSVKNIRIA